MCLINLNKDKLKIMNFMKRVLMSVVVIFAMTRLFAQTNSASMAESKPKSTECCIHQQIPLKI
jgi:hypothetical protein